MNFTIEFDATQYFKGENSYSLIYKKPYDNGSNQFTAIGGYPPTSTYDVFVGWFASEDSATAFAKTLKGKLGRKVTFTV